MIYICTSLWILWGFGWDTVGRRLWTQVDGIVIASRDVPSTGAPRYATQYVVRSHDGDKQVFWAGPTDGSLDRSMPVGTQIRKERWHLDYERDGQTEGFPVIFYGVMLSLAVGLMSRGLLTVIQQRTWLRTKPDAHPGQ